MRKTVLLFSITCFLSTISFSQIDPNEIDLLIKEGSEQQLVNECSRLAQEDFLYYADKIASRLLEIKPNSCNYHFRKGYTTLYSLNDPVSARDHLLIAITSTDANYDGFSKKEKSAPIDAHFHLAECYHKLGDYDKALDQLSVFKSKSRKESELNAKIDLKIQQIENAKNIKQSTVNSDPLTEVNTEFPDYAPLISPDGTMLFFTARRPWELNKTALYNDRVTNFPPEDSYLAKKENNLWSYTERLSACEPKWNEASLAMSSDERNIILYSDSTGNGDLMFGRTGEFIIEKDSLQVDTLINTEFWETHATYSADGRTLLFVSDRDGGLGGRDIYIMKKDDSGKWSTPTNIGSPVNSVYDEDGPFLSFNGKDLYFSSNGKRSYGGFDIFRSSLNEDGTWTEPYNLGTPYNSTFDDVFYSSTLDATEVYFSSNRLGGKGALDIYSVKGESPYSQIAILKGKVKTSTGEQIPSSAKMITTLKCSGCKENEKSFEIYPRLRDGMFFSNLEPCQTYSISLSNPGQDEAFHSETFTTDCEPAYQEIVREFLYDMDKDEFVPNIQSVETEDTLIAEFKNFEFMHYFDYNKNKVTSTDTALVRIFKELENQINSGRESVVLNIYSSASKVPTKTYNTNENLAEIRANNLVNELNKIIAANKTLQSKVKIQVTSIVVDGPEYKKDANNKGKYKPYQFVAFKTE